MPRFHHLPPGQKLRKFPASDWNAVMDMARQHYATQHKMVGGQKAFSPQVNPTVVQVQNTTEDDLTPGDCLVLSGLAIEPVGGDIAQVILSPTFNGSNPEAGNAYKTVVLIDAIAKGQIGRAVISGVVAAPVELSQSGADTMVGLDVDGEEKFRLYGSKGDIEILWRPTDQFQQTGLQWCLLLLGGGSPNFLYVQLVDQVNQGGSGTAHRYKIENDGWAVDNQNDLEVYAPPLTGTGQYYPSGTICTVAKFPDYGRYVILSAACGGC